jgi:hypothetical protein
LLQQGMRHALKLHPASHCAAIAQFEVEVERSDAGALLLSYGVTGAIGDLRLPDKLPAARADELWQHTCFEVFLGAPLGAAYYEFNLAPSTQWAAYRFDRYRGGMRVATEMSEPRIAAQATAARYVLQATLQLDRIDLPRGARRLGVAAVIEEKDGNISYWALAHPPGRPDFHHADGLVHELS